MSDQPQQAWKAFREEPAGNLELFRAVFTWFKNPRNQHPVKAVILKSPDWVNVLALTPDRKVVTVRQFRFGTQRWTTETPAGLMEDGESPLQAAQRELAEETGYTTAEWEYLGCVEPNPAFMDNVCHLWLAKNARRTDDTDFDPGEDIRVEELALPALKKEIQSGRLRHSLALIAVSRVVDPLSCL